MGEFIGSHVGAVAGANLFVLIMVMTPSVIPLQFKKRLVMDKWPKYVTPSFTGWLPDKTEVRLSEVPIHWRDMECSTTYYFSEEEDDKALYLGRYGEKMFLLY